MGIQRGISQNAIAAYVIAAIFVFLGVYWAYNAYTFAFGSDTNAIAVAADASMASLALLAAVFVIVIRGFSVMNSHLENIEAAAQEQVKLLRYLAKQNSKPNPEQSFFNVQD